MIIKRMISTVALGAVIVALSSVPKTSAIAADPVAAACTSAQSSAFSYWALAAATLDECAVAGPYALLGFAYNDTGETVLLQQNASGQWTLVVRTGGQLIPDTMVESLPSLPADTAQSLYSVVTSQNPPG
jgi:hypothetical protein